MKRRSALICLGLATLATSAVAQPERASVDDLRTLLIAALKSPAGRADGVLTGRVPTGMSRMFATTAPLWVDVSTLKTYREPGCARLNVKFSQSAVVETKDKGPSDKVLAVQLNYCLDGRPPKRID